MEFKLTIDASPELLKVLNALVSAFIPAAVTPAENVTNGKPLTVVPGKVVNGAASANGHKKPQAEAPAATATEVATDTAVATETISIEQVRAAVVQKKSQTGEREAIKTLLASFNVKSVTELPKENYADFLTKLNAL